jgi:predicted nucleic acid-binding protein
LYDNQSQILIEVETKAIQYIQYLIVIDCVGLAWSYILDYENSLHPIISAAKEILKWRDLSAIIVDETPGVLRECRKIRNAGIKDADALHIACAIEAKCDYMITVDKRMLKYCGENIKVCDPVDFLRIEGVISDDEQR